MVALAVGKSKVKAVVRHGGDAIPRGGRAGRAADFVDELSFQLRDRAAQPAASFNVMYVRTPRIGVLQAPLFRAFAATCAEAAELVRPILRFGLRETSLFDKCPYYDPEFGRGPSGHMVATRRTRELLGFMGDGTLYRPAPEGIPKERVYIRDFPNAGTVVALNLLAYYLITRQGSRLT